MASDDVLREKVGRRAANRKTGLLRSSMDIPEHLKHGDDEHEDVTAATGKNREQYMHQSIFSMITAAGHRGRRTDFISRFDEDPSESEEDGEHTQRQSQTATAGDELKDQHTKAEASKPSKSGNKLLQSLPRLDKLRHRKDKQPSADAMSSSQILPPRPQWQEEAKTEEEEQEPVSEAPMLSRMLTARAEMEASEPSPAAQKSKDEVVVGTTSVMSPVSLAERLREIFAFDEAEKVIAEYPCWLLQTVLLQGFMYLTQKHVCFYAYLPKREVSLFQHLKPIFAILTRDRPLSRNQGISQSAEAEDQSQCTNGIGFS